MCLQTKAAPHSSQLEALQRDNAILKRAVAIQNSRMQEMAGREAEVVQLRAVAKVSQLDPCRLVHTPVLAPE